MNEHLLNAIQTFYKHQDKKTYSTNECVLKIKRYIQINHEELNQELKNEIMQNGSINFLTKLENKNIIEKAPGYCTCNGGTWRKV